MSIVKSLLSNFSRANPIFRTAADLLYPDKCGLCDFVGDGSPCSRCLSQFDITDQSLALGHDVLKQVIVIFPYDGVAREAVRMLKFHRHTSLAAFMAKEMAAAVNRFGLEHLTAVPVPIHRSRMAQRGFNQAEILCEALINPRLDSGLVRVRSTKPQAMLTPIERATNLIGAFEAGNAVEGLEILLIDDVCTTGHTVTECAKSILAKGAESVSSLCFAGGR